MQLSVIPITKCLCALFCDIERSFYSFFCTFALDNNSLSLYVPFILMELRQLKYFLRVAETLNFSAAARDLFITQSTLSQQILQLEREFNQPLFIRNSHEVSLTEAGQTLLPLAMETIHAADNCQIRLEELGTLMSGELNIGVTFSFTSIMAETLSAFLRLHPHVKVNIIQSTMADLIERLTHHEFDFVLAFKPLVGNPRIESRPIFSNRLAVIVDENHVLASRDSITLEELQRFDMAMPRKGLQARNAFDQVIAGTGYHYHIKVEMNTVYLIFRVVRDSNYVTVLSESTVVGERGLCAIPIQETDAPGFDMEGCIHLEKNAYVKKATKEFIRLLGESSAILRHRLEQV